MSKKYTFKEIKKINLKNSRSVKNSNLWLNKRKNGINNTRKGAQSWCKA